MAGEPGGTAAGYSGRGGNVGADVALMPIFFRSEPALNNALRRPLAQNCCRLSIILWYGIASGRRSFSDLTIGTECYTPAAKAPVRLFLCCRYYTMAVWQSGEWTPKCTVNRGYLRVISLYLDDIRHGVEVCKRSLAGHWRVCCGSGHRA